MSSARAFERRAARAALERERSSTAPEGWRSCEEPERSHPKRLIDLGFDARSLEQKRELEQLREEVAQVQAIVQELKAAQGR